MGEEAVLLLGGGDQLLTTLDVLNDGRLGVGVGLGWMKQEYDIARNADWHRRGKMLDDMLAFLHAWWTTSPVSWDSEFFTLPPVHADLRPVQIIARRCATECCTVNQASGEQTDDRIDARTLNPRPPIHRRNLGLRN
jgi:hypothetical protein